MTSPLAKGLFAKAVAFSGSVLNRLGPSDLKTAESNGAKFVAAMGAPDKGAIAALRRMPQADIIKVMMGDPKIHASEPRGPVVDHYVFPEPPALVFQAGHEAAVPFIIGHTAREGDEDSMGVSGTPKADATLADKARPLAGARKPTPLDAAGEKQVQAYYAKYGDLAGTAAKLYGGTGGPGGWRCDLCAFTPTPGVRCGDGMMAAWHARVAPTWRYQFSHGYEPLGAVHLWDTCSMSLAG